MRPILLLAAVLSLAGCGNDDSADEYRERAVALCDEAVESVEDIAVPGSEDEIVDYLEEVVREQAQLSDDFAALEPPDALANLHERAVRENERGDRAFRALIDRVEGAPNPIAALRREILALAPLIRRSEALARELGIEECAEFGPAGGDRQAPS